MINVDSLVFNKHDKSAGVYKVVSIFYYNQWLGLPTGRDQRVECAIVKHYSTGETLTIDVDNLQELSPLQAIAMQAE